MTRFMDRASRLPEWQLNAIGIGACAALVGAWYLIGFAPLSDARAQRRALQLEVDQKREQAAHLVKIQRAHEQSRRNVEEHRERLDVRLESPDQLLKRMAELTGAALQVGLSLDETKPGIATAHGRFTTVPVKMTGTGSFLACTQFLHQLRARFRDTGVVGIVLRGEPAQSEKPAKFVLELVWYAAGPAPPAKAAQADGGNSN